MQHGQQVKATPARGMRVRKEDGSILPEAGDVVTLNGFWKRREIDGDVTLTELAKFKKSAE